MLQIPTQRIALIYGQYPNGNIELEARFGTFKERYFDTSITREVYNRIFEQFSTNRTNVVPIHEITIDHVEGDIRRTVYQEPIREDVWITKNNIRGGRFDLPDYGIRLTWLRRFQSNRIRILIQFFLARKIDILSCSLVGRLVLI